MTPYLLHSETGTLICCVFVPFVEIVPTNNHKIPKRRKIEPTALPWVNFEPLAGLDWWRTWLEPYNGTLHGNRSIDVLCANCVTQKDVIACVRTGCVSLLAGISTLVAVRRVGEIYRAHQSPLQMLLYLVVVVHCIAGSFEWLLGWTTQLALFISYTKAIELLIICYFYLDVASKMMHWSSAAGRRICLSSLILLFTYFTLFIVMGFLLSIEPWQDCHAPYWIWFSTGEFLTVQLMVFSFALIVGRMNRISAAPNIQKRQRAKLMSLFWVFETSCLADLGYHISLFILADDEKGCSGIFKHDQLRYTLLKLPYDVVSFLLPVWTILYVFRPAIKDDTPVENSAESYITATSSISDVIVVRNWRRRYRPLVQDNSAYVPAPQLRRVAAQRAREANRARSGSDGMRRVSTAPSLPHIPRRASVSRSLISSPLYPIPEELQQHVAAMARDSSIDNLSTAAQLEFDDLLNQE